MSLIEATDLSKIYEGRSRNVVAIDGIDLSLGPGEAMGILGYVGSGKSTLFRLLAGLVLPTTGVLLLNDRPAGDPRSRIGVGFVPDHPKFPGHVTAFAALQIAARLDGVPKDELEGRVILQLERMELTKWAETAVSKFSRDMARRLALASALLSSPHLLIVDEPPEKIDLVTRGLMVRALRFAKESGTSILHLAHSVSCIERTVDRVLIMERGRITRDVPMAELVQNRLLVEIEADIGERLIDLPPELGQVVSVSRKRLIVELEDESSINGIIDHLRLNRIQIHTVERRKNSPDSTWLGNRKSPEEVSR